MGIALTLAATSDYIDSGATSDSDLGTATILAVPVRLRGSALNGAAGGFEERRVMSIGGSSHTTNRLTVSIDGGSGDVRVKMTIGNEDNGHAATSGAASEAIGASTYYTIYAEFGSGTGIIALLKDDGTVLCSQATMPGGASMPSASTNGRVRIGAALYNTTGVTDRIDGVAIYTARRASGSRHVAPSTGDSSIEAFWGFDASSGANGVSGGLALGTATAGVSYTSDASATWEHSGGTPPATGKPTHMMHYARLRRAA